MDEYKDMDKIVIVHDDIQGDWVGKIKRTLQGSQNLCYEVVPCGYFTPLRIDQSNVEFV